MSKIMYKIHKSFQQPL